MKDMALVSSISIDENLAYHNCLIIEDNYLNLSITL